MKPTYDYLAMHFAYKVCMDLCRKHSDNAEAHAVMLKAAEVFHQAMKESDAEMTKLEMEQTGQTTADCVPVMLEPIAQVEKRLGFESSESAANFNRSLQRDAKHWGNDEEDRDSGIAPVFSQPDPHESEYGDE